MKSKEFFELETAIFELKTHFLSFPARPDGDYLPEELLSCRAYIAFVHAEIEFYLEEVALRRLRQAVEKWKNRAEAGRVIAAVLAYKSEKVAVSDRIKELPAAKRLDSIIHQACASHIETIKLNNGIKQINFSQIFVPIGVDPDGINEVLVSELESFGSKRGDLVHVGHEISIQSLRDPFTVEERQIKQLLTELGEFDRSLRALS